MRIRKLLVSIAMLFLLTGTNCMEGYAAEITADIRLGAGTKADGNLRAVVVAVTEPEEYYEEYEENMTTVSPEQEIVTEAPGKEATEDVLKPEPETETPEQENAQPQTEAPEQEDAQPQTESDPEPKEAQEETLKETVDSGISETAAVFLPEEERFYTDEDLMYLSCVIYAEAGDQCYEGKLAVANVVLNRMDDRDPYGFGHANTIEEVIYDKRWGVQFSVTIGGSKSRIAKAIAMYESDEYPNKEEQSSMVACKRAAKEALEGENNIGDYLFFRMYNKTTQERYPDHLIIEDHIFYNTR